MMLSILGPTLLILADNVNKGVSEVSYIFTCINFGILVGGIAAGHVGNKLNRLYTYGNLLFTL